jgi:hypothetical protein
MMRVQRKPGLHFLSCQLFKATARYAAWRADGATFFSPIGSSASTRLMKELPMSGGAKT